MGSFFPLVPVHRLHGVLCRVSPAETSSSAPEALRALYPARERPCNGTRDSDNSRAATRQRWHGCAGLALVVVDHASLGLHGLRPRLWPCSSLEADGPSVHTTPVGNSERSWYRKMVHRRQGRFQHQSRQGSAVRRSAQSYGSACSSGGGGAGPAETGDMVRVQTGDVKWIDAGVCIAKEGATPYQGERRWRRARGKRLTIVVRQ